MREIKFRAWHPTAKDMVYFGLGENNLSCYCLEDGQSYTMEDVNDYPVMQFTGLLDKNYVEIYEGDLLKWVSSNPFSKGEIRMVQVNYVQAQFWCQGTICVYLAELLANEKCEVIGNIYQNHELIWQ